LPANNSPRTPRDYPGYERDELEIYNLFIQENEGEYVFDGNCSTQIRGWLYHNFRNGYPRALARLTSIYENARPTNNPNDGLPSGVTTSTRWYAQDEFTFGGGDTLLLCAPSDRRIRAGAGCVRVTITCTGAFTKTRIKLSDGMDLIPARIALTGCQ